MFKAILTFALVLIVYILLGYLAIWHPVGFFSTVIPIMVLWNVVPFIMIQLTPVSSEVRRGLRKSFQKALIGNLKVFPFNLTAPLIVPFALYQTKWVDNKLPQWAWRYDNDASISGDNVINGSQKLVPISLEEDNQADIDLCYWAKGHHPRSNVARYLWLTRNRASKYAFELGFSRSITEGGENYEYFGTEKLVKGQNGWTVYSYLCPDGHKEYQLSFLREFPLMAILRGVLSLFVSFVIALGVGLLLMKTGHVFTLLDAFTLDQLTIGALGIFAIVIPAVLFKVIKFKTERRFQWRFNWGYKIWRWHFERPKAAVVGITFTVVSAVGRD